MRRRITAFAFLFLLFDVSLLHGFPLLEDLDRREVRTFIQRFQTAEREFLEKGLRRSALYLSPIRQVLREEGLPAELAWLPLIESGFSTRARSRAGAVGLWQLTDPTARHLGLVIDFWVDERRDPFKSTRGAATFLKDLYGYYDDWALALAAYNAGMGRINRAIRLAGSDNFWDLAGSGYLNRETRDYVPRFIAAAHIAENPEAYDFTVRDPVSFPEFEELSTDRPVDLTLLGARSGVPLQEIAFLNPALTRLVTPPGRPYPLRVPAGTLARVVRAYHNLPESALEEVMYYTVRSGDTLGDIADRFQISRALLQTINSVGNPRRLLAGSRILVPRRDSDRENPGVQEYPIRKEFTTRDIGYVVGPGDTLWELAQRFRVDVEMILAANGLSYQSIIRPGDRITILVDTVFTP